MHSDFRWNERLLPSRLGRSFVFLLLCQCELRGLWLSRSRHDNNRTVLRVRISPSVHNCHVKFGIEAESCLDLVLREQAGNPREVIQVNLVHAKGLTLVRAGISDVLQEWFGWPRFRTGWGGRVKCARHGLLTDQATLPPNLFCARIFVLKNHFIIEASALTPSMEISFPRKARSRASTQTQRRRPKLTVLPPGLPSPESMQRGGSQGHSDLPLLFRVLLSVKSITRNHTSRAKISSPPGSSS